MQQYPTDKLVHIIGRIQYLKENAVHHREQPNKLWPDNERNRIRDLLLETLPWMDEMSLSMTKRSCEQLAADVLHLGIQGAMAKADSVRSTLELELKQRKFLVLHADDVKYYNNPLLAGARFKDNWPEANRELIEAGNCFALDRYTACVCHVMRSLEYALKAFETALRIQPPPPGPNNTWGNIIGRIEKEKGRPPAGPSVEWAKHAAFYDNCLAFFARKVRLQGQDVPYRIIVRQNQRKTIIRLLGCGIN